MLLWLFDDTSFFIYFSSFFPPLFLFLSLSLFLSLTHRTRPWTVHTAPQVVTFTHTYTHIHTHIHTQLTHSLIHSHITRMVTNLGGEHTTLMVPGCPSGTLAAPVWQATGGKLTCRPFWRHTPPVMRTATQCGATKCVLFDRAPGCV